MSSTAKKLYKKWSSQIPVEARANEVRTFIDYYFAGEWNQDGTSHIIIRSERLQQFEEFKPYGEITVPVKSGNRVKGFYIKKILKGIKLLETLEEDYQ